VLASVTVVVLVWTGLSVWSFRRLTVLGTPRRGPSTAWFRQLDLVLRLAAAVGFAGFGIASLVGASDVFAADFVAIKAVLFATLVLAGLRLRLAAAPVRPALRAVVDTGGPQLG